jgi:hypothetical protein
LGWLLRFLGDGVTCGQACICRQSDPFNSKNGAGLIVIGVITADTDGTHDVAIGCPNEHAAGDRNNPAVGDAGKGRKECRRHLRALRESPAPQSHAQRAPGLTLSDVGPQNAGSVLPLERYQMTARVQHGDRQGLEPEFARSIQACIDDAFCLSMKKN